MSYILTIEVLLDLFDYMLIELDQLQVRLSHLFDVFIIEYVDLWSSI